MNQKFLITKIFFQEKKYLLWSLLEEEKIVELYVTPVSSQEILGNLYVGRVKDVVKNLNAAFVEISPRLKQLFKYFLLLPLHSPVMPPTAELLSTS